MKIFGGIIFLLFATPVLMELSTNCAKVYNICKGMGASDSDLTTIEAVSDCGTMADTITYDTDFSSEPVASTLAASMKAMMDALNTGLSTLSTGDFKTWLADKSGTTAAAMAVVIQALLDDEDINSTYEKLIEDAEAESTDALKQEAYGEIYRGLLDGNSFSFSFNSLRLGVSFFALVFLCFF